jgi:hypothetical protein
MIDDSFPMEVLIAGERPERRIEGRNTEMGRLLPSHQTSVSATKAINPNTVM